MFSFASAFVHFGARSQPLVGLEEKFASIASVDALDLTSLKAAIGSITGFPVEMRAQLCPALDLMAEAKKHGVAVESDFPSIPERIVAQGNGYTITWNKVG